MKQIDLGTDVGMADGVENFIQSALFTRTFREGMSLVEETANYLDGEGRELSKDMSRNIAMAYAGSSMRLTTQLMQIASWLLVLRALREGDMTLAEAQEDKYRIRGRDNPSYRRSKTENLPSSLVTLIEDADQLYDRISRLDEGLFGDEGELQEQNGAVAQQQALLDAFGGKS